MYRWTSWILACFTITTGVAQSKTLTLDTSLALARENYPLIRQLDLIRSSESYTLSNLSRAWWPQINVTGQLSYQSDVTMLSIPVPGIPVPEPISKDQYKFYADVGQMIYDGGAVRNQRQLARSSAQMEILKTESELYRINERVMQLYFGCLLIQKQMDLTALLQKDLDEQIKKADAAWAAQTISAATRYALLAERIKSGQRMLELRSQFQLWKSMLARFIGMDDRLEWRFVKPDARTWNGSINRWEMQLFDRQAMIADQQWKLNRSKVIPRLQAFGQLGYANPALNFLKNEFDTYYIAGLRLSWNLSAAYNLHGERKLGLLQKSIAELQKESFVFNTQLQLLQQIEEQNKLEALLRSDDELVDLRNRIKLAAKAQWENGMIPVSDYLREWNAADQAEVNRTIHEIQVLQASYLNAYHNGNLSVK
ncbi:MAG TPA: TolC family protein [Saprospiraceae bacterium]|nr:TolC family protein [Saprospiraceae bacterium]